ncbi:hypothetical protein [Arthrobacter sp. G119Y2]|uniref:hypothetical protein n=1 Tax=Arthrobacter sp. G119Y2 TaxID=3134965 RepID=UPI00311A68B2
MMEHPWPCDVAEHLRAFLAEAFPGVQFQAVPMVAYDIATIDVSWTDGPSLHEVDMLALEFVLRVHLDAWGTRIHPKIDRVSNRRTMSPAAEDMLSKALAADMALDFRDLDVDRVYPLPPILASSRYCPRAGTVPEFLDLLFEATSFSLGRAVGIQPVHPCTCALCA